MDQIQLASIDDPIARAQAGRVRALLEAGPDPLAIVWMVFESSASRAEQMARLTEKLLDRDVDVVAYPAERLPAHLPEGIALRAMIRDRGAHYCCLSTGRPVLSAMRPDARLVTCDAVARAQLRHRYPRLRTDLATLCSGVLDGLKRGEWEAAVAPPALLESGSLVGLHYEPVAVEDVTPAVGLGMVAVLGRNEPTPRHDLVAQLNDPEAALLFEAERSFLSGACQGSDTVCTARARLTGDMVEVTGLIIEPDGRWLVRDQGRAPFRFASIVGREVADSCVEMMRERVASPTFEKVPSF